jgi:hypothetical protein
MGADGLFTDSDLMTICRAASLAERLTERHFSLGKDHWRIEPYKIFTLKQVSQGLYEPDVFANVVKFKARTEQQKQKWHAPAEKYGIVLQDPNILRALLRQSHHDLWTMSLFVLTHELIHVVRFKKFNVDFFAGTQARQTEESLVQSITGEILSGVTNTDRLLALYADSKDMLEKAN